MLGVAVVDLGMVEFGSLVEFGSVCDETMAGRTLPRRWRGRRSYQARRSVQTAIEAERNDLTWGRDVPKRVVEIWHGQPM